MPVVTNADIEWQADGTPYCRRFGDIYFSRQGGPAESRHVFLEANRLAERWAASNGQSPPFLLVELGFGTGLNFLLSWELFERVAAPGTRLHYLAFEAYPLTRDDLQRALRNWQELAAYASPLTREYTDHTGGMHRYQLTDTVTLDLYFGDALTGLTQLFDDLAPSVDCWFMDGFAPARNPALWSSALFQRMAALSRSGATASTYSVAGEVRRGLAAAGFTTERLPGFGNKRHMLLAGKSPAEAASAAARAPQRSPWLRHDPDRFFSRSATVIGAGLAGCSTAYSLARRGWQVTLIEEHQEIASGASGNPRAVLQPRLVAECNAQSRFFLHGFLFANRQFSRLQQQHNIGWEACGVLRLINAGSRQGSLTRLLEGAHQVYDERAVRRVSRDEAGELAGLPVSDEALWLPAGGCLNPSQLCQAYLAAIPGPQLTLLTGHRVVGLEQRPGSWRVLGLDGCLADTAVVVIANSFQATRLRQTGFLPLTPVGGQLTEIAVTPSSRKLACAVVAERYICPARAGRHCVGASYASGEIATRSSPLADQQNLAGVAAALGDITLPASSGSRVSTRCNAVDYYPVVGPVPDREAFARVYAPLARNARARVTGPAPCLPGLYTNVAHGSYGLASCPLSGELLASLISRESPPVPLPLVDSLNPARFLIRHLKKQRSSAAINPD